AARIHAHVERALLGEREAALGAVELRRADAEIDHDPIDGSVEDRAQLGEPSVDQTDAVAESCEPGFGRLQRPGIAIDTNRARSGDLQDGFEMTAAARSSVAINLVI